MSGGPFGRRPGRLATTLLALLGLLVAFVVVSELLGWRYLAGTVERTLNTKLEREVSMKPEGSSSAQWRLHLIGGIHVKLPYLRIAAPAWSKAPHFVLVHDGDIKLRYVDAIRAARGGPVRIKQLLASQLDVQAERLADGRASWQFGPPKPADPAASAAQIPTFDRLEVASGLIRYDDAALGLETLTRLSLDESGRGVSSRHAANMADVGAPAASPVVAVGDLADQPPRGLRAITTGSYKKSDVKVSLQTVGVLPWINAEDPNEAVPFSIDAKVGTARATFNGTSTGGMKMGKLAGDFSVKGPSLASAGDALGVTLPTTSAFSTRGKLSRDGATWQVAFDDAVVGQSQLHGAFRYDGVAPAGHKVPFLQGRLAGQRLFLADLAPAIGAAPKPAGAASTSSTEKPKNAPGTKVLPDRKFDLPSLRAMDANVVVDVDHVDLGGAFAEPLQPFKGQLQLQSGVLTLGNIDARTADGRVFGMLRLDGNPPHALWRTDLGWSDVRLERWLRQPRDGKLPPYIAGEIDGRAQLEGAGRSTAEILGSLQGTLGVRLRNGAVSHLIVEGAGLDVAQGLGVYVKGDDALPVQCGVAELKADKGVLRPELMVINTSDSTIWVTGSISLATEAMDLRAVTTPKDFSPMALRTPVRLQGTFGNPSVALEKTPLLEKGGAAVLLALVNPLAALIPFIDPGNKEAAEKGAAGCKQFAARATKSTPATSADVAVGGFCGALALTLHTR